MAGTEGHREPGGAAASQLRVRVLRVFTDESGRFGNRLGIADGGLVAPDRRQAVAHELGFSETVFVDDSASGALRIFTPDVELPLAGHPLVGAAWALGTSLGQESLTLLPPGGAVRAWGDPDGRTWIDAPLRSLPDWTLVELGSPREVDDLAGPLRADHDHVVYFAAVSDGVLRVRCFAPAFGIFEDEATGSAGLRLAALLARTLEIRQGKGSLLFARPIDSDRAAVGGFVVEDDPVALRL